MKILYITSGLNVNDGWGRYGNILLKHIVNKEEILVVCNEIYPDLNLKQLALLDKPEKYLSSPIRSGVSSLKLQKIIDQFKPDTVHFIVEPYINLIPFLKFNNSTKIFLTIHGTYSFIPSLLKDEKIKSFFAKSLSYKSLSKLDGVISISTFTKNYFLKEYSSTYKKDFDERKIKIISNGIDLENFSYSPSEKKNEIKSLVFVGAVKKRKGLLEAINALGEYRKKYGGKFSYNIIGAYKESDPYFKLLKLKISELELNKQILFKGRVDEEELKSIYLNCDLFLMTPIMDKNAFEGFGLVYLEANAYGVPVIGARDSGASEAIIEGKTGYLIDPYNSIEVSDRIYDVLENKSINSQDCIDWAKKQDIKEKAKLILEFYREV